jgi:hypothetical protein
MTTINPNSVSGNKNFKQIESDSWTSLYLPAICAAVLMGGVLFLAVSCSKTSTNASKISAPTQQSAASTPPSSTPIATAPEKTKKMAKKRRPANATYVNSAYGVSFRYPRKYSLQSGDKLAASTSLPTGFLKPGAVQVAAVDMPDDSYPETDFSSALLNVSVNKEVTSDECMQFGAGSKEAGEVKSATGKLGANEYSVFEQIIGEGARKSDLKYFHLFKNNACSEFALDVDTVGKDTADKADSDLAQVDRGKVFHQLEAILTTAKIRDLQPTEVENAGNAATTATSSAEVKATEVKTAEVKVTQAKDEQTQKAQVVTPEK